MHEEFPGGELSHACIEHETDRDIDGNPTEHYDLRNNNGDLVCMDGEEVEVIWESEDAVTFLNENGEEPTKFTLSRTEYETAVFKEQYFTADELLMMSDVVLRLIKDACTAQKLISDDNIQADIKKHIEELHALNAKICGLLGK